MKMLSARHLRLAALSLIAPVLAFGAAPASAQGIQTVDPDLVIDGDLQGEAPTADNGSQTYDNRYEFEEATAQNAPDNSQPVLDLPPQDTTTDPVSDPASPVDPAPAAQPQSETYAEDDLIGAAEGLFGRGAEGLARLIQDILADQGEPNAYIVGREAGGAFVVGVRYGSGTLYHAVEGNMPVYWTGPSIGLDAGANAGNTFVLVYNLHDTDELYERYPAGEGQAYFVGGFHASYVRKGDVVMIPIRVGAGLRLGVNAGYMRFSREQRWLPF